MANIDQTDANNLLLASLGKQAYPATTAPVKLRLMDASGTAPSATVNGTEITGGSYAAGGQDLSAATPAAGSITGGTVSNNAAVNFTGMPAKTVNAVEIWDSAGTPKRKWWGSITPKTTNAGDTLSFAAGAITIGMS